MSVLAIAFLVSLIIIFLIVRYSHLHLHYSADSDLLGIQKFHVNIVPRIGGIGIILGLCAAFYLRYAENKEIGTLCFFLLISSLPAFIFGLLEDLTKKITAALRLSATIISAVLAGYFLGAWLTNIQVLGVDNLMASYPFFAIVITCIAVAGLANSFNIIDGYNGLSSMIGIIILCGIVYVAFLVNDYFIMVAALAMIGALLGFLVFNYPRGLIFMGDGGAYLLGFWIAELSVLLTSRHIEISKWFPLLLCMYPITETLFTIYRRIVLIKTHPGMPDASHLHQLIYRRVIRMPVGLDPNYFKNQRNSMTSPYLWLLCLLAVIPAVLFWRYHLALKAFALIFIIIYVWFYWSIVRFRIPKFLIISRFG